MKELGFTALAIKEIHPSPFNPREPDMDISYLKANIEKLDLLIHPVLVRPVAEGYQIIDGHLRWRVHNELGKETLFVRIIEASDEEVMTFQLSANEFRYDFSSLQKAQLCHRMITQLDWDVKRLSEELRITERTIHGWLSLLKLPDEIKKRIGKATRGKIPRGKLAGKEGMLLAKSGLKDSTIVEIADAQAEARLSSKELCGIIGIVKEKPDYVITHAFVAAKERKQKETVWAATDDSPEHGKLVSIASDIMRILGFNTREELALEDFRPDVTARRGNQVVFLEVETLRRPLGKLKSKAKSRIEGARYAIVIPYEITQFDEIFLLNAKERQFHTIAMVKQP